IRPDALSKRRAKHFHNLFAKRRPAPGVFVQYAKLTWFTFVTSCLPFAAGTKPDAASEPRTATVKLLYK
ncbi:hypothetical protein ACXYUI_33695, partial [Klebsiella pneumoniae]